jgi:hypothetical protein
MKIGSPLRGVASPPFIVLRSSFPLSSWGRGHHKWPRRRDSYCLGSLVDVVFIEQWRRSTGVGGGS